MLMDDVFIGAELPAGIRCLAAVDISGLFQLIDRRADGILAFPVDMGQPGEGIVPILRQRQHLREQALGLQRQAFVPQMVIAHNCIVPRPFHAKYGHLLHSFLVSAGITKAAGGMLLRLKLHRLPPFLRQKGIR